MARATRIILQAIVYAAIAIAIGYLSAAPAYRPIPSGKGLITLTFVHAGARRFDCRRLTAEEIAALPPNMRRPEDCPRERVPLYTELSVDGNVLIRADLEPAGVARDGPASVYRKLLVDPGRRHISVRLRDTSRAEGYDHVFERTVEIAPGQHVVIDFRPEQGGFQLL